MKETDVMESIQKSGEPHLLQLASESSVEAFLIYISCKAQRSLWSYYLKNGETVSYNEMVDFLHANQQSKEAVQSKIQNMIMQKSKTYHYDFELQACDIDFLKDDNSETLCGKSLFERKQGESLIEAIMFQAEIEYYRYLVDRKQFGGNWRAFIDAGLTWIELFDPCYVAVKDFISHLDFDGIWIR